MLNGIGGNEVDANMSEVDANMSDVTLTSEVPY